MSEALTQLIDRLRTGQTVPISEAAVSVATLQNLGLEVSGESVRWPADSEPLQAQRILADISGRTAATAARIQVLSVVGSTNDWLRERSVAAPVMDRDDLHWQVVTAECQVAGKGRLGRQWNTPIGGGLAVSIGLRVHRGADALGGLSLVVGLAVLEALDPDGRFGLCLKWPNDILCGRSKLGGILIELLRFEHATSELIIGLGLNYRLTDQVQAQIDRTVTDLRQLGVTDSRNQVLSTLLVQLGIFVAKFEQHGFQPFQSAFNAVHLYQQRSCRLTGGVREVEGVVQGVDEQGRLILSTDNGLAFFNAGEVSLREH